MTQQLSTGLCNKLLDTNCFKTIFASGFVQLYSGTVPATADASIGSAVLQVKVGAPGPGTGLTFASSASGGVLAKNGSETWTGTVSNTATVTFFRLVAAADDGTSSTTQARIQGTIGAGGADMNLGTTALVAAAPFTLNYFTEAFVPS